MHQVQQTVLGNSEGNGMQYEAVDTDQNRMPLQDADRKRLERDSDQLSDTLHLKV